VAGTTLSNSVSILVIIVNTELSDQEAIARKYCGDVRDGFWGDDTRGGEGRWVTRGGVMGVGRVGEWMARGDGRRCKRVMYLVF